MAGRIPPLAPGASGTLRGFMLKLETRRGLGGAALAVCLGYALALQLILAGLLSGAQAAQSAGALGLSAHVLCLNDPSDGDAGPGESTPAGPHRHDLCCTLACGGVALPAPQAFEAVAYAAAVLAVVPATADFGARPATAPPGLGQGPRAPPADLV